MRYTEYRDAIAKSLRKHPRGLSWAQLKAQLALPQRTPCPEWTKRLESDIGLRRVKGPTRAFLWTLPAVSSPRTA